LDHKIPTAITSCEKCGLAQAAKNPGRMGKLGKRAARKAGPWAIAAFFCYDLFDGGFGHAVYEATWPLSIPFGNDDD